MYIMLYTPTLNWVQLIHFVSPPLATTSPQSVYIGECHEQGRGSGSGDYTDRCMDATSQGLEVAGRLVDCPSLHFNTVHGKHDCSERLFHPSSSMFLKSKLSVHVY